MIVTQIIRLLQLLGLLALQVLFMNHIQLFGYAIPLVYVAFLIYFPANASRTEILLWSFAMGLAVDAFSNTPGIASGAMTLAGMIRPPLLNSMLSKDEPDNAVPSFRTMGTWTHIRFIFILIVIHHILFFALESFSFVNLKDIAISWAGTVLLTLFVVIAMEAFRGNKPQNK